MKTEKRRQRKKKEDEPSETKKTQPEDLFTFDEGKPADAPSTQEQNSASLLEMDDPKKEAEKKHDLLDEIFAPN